MVDYLNAPKTMDNKKNDEVINNLEKRNLPKVNNNIKKYHGLQKIPSRLKDINDKQKRHAYFFKKILKDTYASRNRSKSSSLFNKLYDKAAKL